MNKLITVPFANPAQMFKPTFIVVEGISEDGYPCTLGVIYHNKHGRHNLSRPGGEFLAGSRNLDSVKKYARTVSAAERNQVFINGGRIQSLGTRAEQEAARVARKQVA
jgi:hypothetical protein